MVKARKTGVKKGETKHFDPMSVDFGTIQYLKKTENWSQDPRLEKIDLQSLVGDLSLNLKNDQMISSLQHSKLVLEKRAIDYTHRIKSELLKNTSLITQTGAYFLNSKYTHTPEQSANDEKKLSIKFSDLNRSASSQFNQIPPSEANTESLIIQKKCTGLPLDRIITQGFPPDRFNFLSIDPSHYYNHDGTRKPSSTYLCQPSGIVLLSIYGPHLFKLVDGIPQKIGLFHIQVIEVENYLGKCGRLLYCMTRKSSDSPLKESCCVIRDLMHDKLIATRDEKNLKAISIKGSISWVFLFENEIDAQRIQIIFE